MEVHLLIRSLRGPYSMPHVNEIDLGLQSEGYILFRLVHPKDHTAMEISKPITIII